MKLIPLICLLGLLTSMCHAQNNPHLKLAGSNFSFARGNIDHELLIQLIQDKQDEVKQHLFRKLITKYFKGDSIYEKSFTTYYYTYNLMNAITVDKNKTIVTRNIIKTVLEYAIVTGFAKTIRDSLKYKESYKSLGISSQYFLENLTSDNLEATTKKADTSSKPRPRPRTKDEQNSLSLKALNDNSWKNYNILCDLIYDVIFQDITDRSLRRKGLFNSFDEKDDLYKWYKADNAYLQKKQSNSLEVTALRKYVEKKYESLKSAVYDTLNNRGFGAKELIDVWKELEDNDYTVENITKKQFVAMRKLMMSATAILKNYKSNNIIANMTNFLLEYTLIEFPPSDTAQKQGILYVDIEGLLAVLYQKYVNSVKNSPIRFDGIKRFMPRPFLLLGTSYSGTFTPGANHLIIKEDGSTENLKSLYYASEKIGLKFTLRDWKYSRSFGPGEQYTYMGEPKRWKTPPTQKTISSLDVYLYASGLLYNIIDAKSAKAFDYSIVGLSFGATMFNGLTVSSGLSLPFTAKGNLGNKFMYNLALDIPIIEYITALGKKNK